MPTTIRMVKVLLAGHDLFRFGGNSLTGKIKIEMYGNKMVIKEDGKEVFSMKKVQVIKGDLLLDYPKTAKGQNGRGWGVLAMLIALYHGQSKGCKTVALGSEIEHTRGSLSFWSKFGISNMYNNPLLRALEKGIGWVLKNCTQSDNTITDFVLLDPVLE
jgi:hypothetical protein